MKTEEILFKRSVKKEQGQHIKPKLKEIAGNMEMAEFGMKYFYLPCFLLGIIFGPTILGTIFMGLFFAFFMTAQVLTETKDIVKEPSDMYQKPQYEQDIANTKKTLENIQNYPHEIEKTKKSIEEKRAKLALLQAKKKSKGATQEPATQTTVQEAPEKNQEQ